MLMTPSEVRRSMGLTPLSETCEWCKQPILVMCQKGTGVCSQRCAKLASDILFDSKDKAEKFGGGYGGSDKTNPDRDFPPAA